MIAYALGKWWWLKTLICQQPLAVRPRCKAAYNQQRAVNQLKLSARNRDNWFHKKVPSVVTFSRFISVFRAEFRPDESGGGLPLRLSIRCRDFSPRPVCRANSLKLISALARSRSLEHASAVCRLPKAFPPRQRRTAAQIHGRALFAP